MSLDQKEDKRSKVRAKNCQRGKRRQRCCMFTRLALVVIRSHPFSSVADFAGLALK